MGNVFETFFKHLEDTSHMKRFCPCFNVLMQSGVVSSSRNEKQ